MRRVWLSMTKQYCANGAFFGGLKQLLFIARMGARLVRCKETRPHHGRLRSQSEHCH